MSRSLKYGGGIVCSITAIIGLVQYQHPEIRTNQAGLEIIGNAEGCRRDPYKCPADVITVGIGSTEFGGEKIVLNRIYSDKEIADRWAKDLKLAESCLNHHFNGKSMNENQFSAMTSAVFNMGCYNLRFYRNKQGQYVQTTIHKLAMKKQFEDMCRRLPDFVRASGKVLNGLVIRREKEKTLCLTGSAVQ